MSVANKFQRQRVVASLFTALWGVAMAAYPGWNSFDSESVGHDFSLNFICDLLSTTTPDGRSNLVTSIAMNIAVVVLVVGGLLPLWWHVAAPRVWRTVSRVSGIAATLLTLTICFEQAFAIPLSHNAITLIAGAAGLFPTALVAFEDWRQPDTSIARRALIVGVLVGATTNFVSYSLVQLGGVLTAVVPLSQKVALVCLVAWLFIKPPYGAAHSAGDR